MAPGVRRLGPELLRDTAALPAGSLGRTSTACPRAVGGGLCLPAAFPVLMQSLLCSLVDRGQARIQRKVVLALTGTDLRGPSEAFTPFCFCVDHSVLFLEDTPCLLPCTPCPCRRRTSQVNTEIGAAQGRYSQQAGRHQQVWVAEAVLCPPTKITRRHLTGIALQPPRSFPQTL